MFNSKKLNKQGEQTIALFLHLLYIKGKEMSTSINFWLQKLYATYVNFGCKIIYFIYRQKHIKYDTIQTESDKRLCPL